MAKHSSNACLNSERNAFVAKKSENSETMGKKRFKRGTRIGVRCPCSSHCLTLLKCVPQLFRSMPPGQLTQEVFMANDKPKLKLPLFKPVRSIKIAVELVFSLALDKEFARTSDKI